MSVHKEIVKTTARMPFSGKYIVKGATTWAMKERNYQTKKKKYAASATLMGVMVGAHAMQAKLGVNGLEHNLPDALHSGSAWDSTKTAIDAVYTTANLAVTYTQSDITRRLSQNFLRARKQFRKLRREGKPVAMADVRLAAQEIDTSFPVEETAELTDEQKAEAVRRGRDVLVTLGGQALFGVSLFV